MSNQNLKGVGYDTTCYTIVFITVSSHNSQVFSFVNQLNNRFDFFWDRWEEWKHHLTPYSSHAFLVRSYNAKTDSGMGFMPIAHLCEFLNLHEARVFNSAYLTKYNKLKDLDDPIEELNTLAGDFGNALLDMAELREDWMELCERTARSVFSRDVMMEFFGDNPTPLPRATPWDKDLFDTSFFDGCGVQEQSLVLHYNE